LNQSISQKIVRNTLFNIAGNFWGILVALVLIPYIIGHIGAERFGVWAIVGVITGYFGLLDFGVGTSFVKYISEYYTKEDFKSLNQVVNTGFVFYSLFGVVIIVLGFLLIKPLLEFFNIPNNIYDEALFVFMIGIIIFAVSNAISAFGAVQTGLQRMDISNKVAITMSIPNIVGTIFFLELGYGLPGLMVNNAIILVLSGIANIVIAFKILPELRFNPSLFNRKMFKRLFSFGYKLQVSRIASLFHFQMDKIILAHFLNIGFVTYYTVAAQLTSRVREMPLLLISAIFPAASELEAKADKDSLYKLYFRSMKYVVLIGLPLSLLSILIANPFINLWLGDGYERSILTLQILMIGYFFNIITGPGFTILNGIGKPQYGMRSSILAGVLNLVLSILLVIKMGYFGVVIGTTISMIVAAIYFISMFHKIMNISIWEMIRKILLKPFVACSITCLIIYIIAKQIERIGWFSLMGVVVSYLILFALIILVVNYLDDFDKTIVNKYSPVRLFKMTEGTDCKN